MTDPTRDPSPSPPLDQTRQLTIDALCEHFANDVMGVEEFERRVDVAHQAESLDELRALLTDLPGGNLPAVAGEAPVPGASRSYSITTADRVQERGFAVAVMSGTRRSGRWTPARTQVAIAIMGGVELDFREAILGPGITDLQVFALWGGVEIIVPPGLRVESQGIGIMGGFDHTGDDPVASDPAAPTLRISGLALMGGVDIKVRYLGESKRDARRRRRQERRDRARSIREGVREARHEIRQEIRRQIRGGGPEA